MVGGENPQWCIWKDAWTCQFFFFWHFQGVYLTRLQSWSILVHLETGNLRWLQFICHSFRTRHEDMIHIRMHALLVWSINSALGNLPLFVMMMGFFSCWEERMRSLVYPRLYAPNLVFAETACFCVEGTQMEGGAGTGWCWSSWESWQSNSSLGVCSVLELPNCHITNVRFIIRCDLTTVHTGFTGFYRWHLNQVCLHLTI